MHGVYNKKANSRRESAFSGAIRMTIVYLAGMICVTRRIVNWIAPLGGAGFAKIARRLYNVCA